MSPADATGVRDELGQRAAQLLSVLGVEVNFVAHAVETERHGLLGRTAVDVVEQLDLNGAGHDQILRYLRVSNIILATTPEYDWQPLHPSSPGTTYQRSDRPAGQHTPDEVRARPAPQRGRRTRRRRQSPRRPDRRPPRRPKHHQAPRPRPQEPRPTPQLHPHRLHGLRNMTPNARLWLPSVSRLGGGSRVGLLAA